MKKIIKSGISILLCAVMMFGAAPLSGLTGALGGIADWIDEFRLCFSASAAEAYESADGLGYTLDANDNAEIIYYSGTETELVLDKVDGHDIVSIGSYAFGGSCLTDVTISGNVKTIGTEAFMGCEYLLNVIMENGVENIGNNAFNYCISLSNLIIPDSVKTIGGGAFDECFCLGYINIPDSVTSIGNAAFARSGLSSITIGTGVTNLGGALFYGCENLYEVTIGSGVINSYIFEGCEWLHSITIGSGVTAICDYAFHGCINLGNVTIENGVKTIGDYLFLSEDVYQRYDYPDITIPESVTYIAPNAFYGVNNIYYSENWYIDAMHRQGAPWGARFANAYADNDLYYYDSSMELLLGCSSEASGTIIIPDTVEEVAESCFCGCENIEALTFLSPVYFADTALLGCDNLQNITAPANTDSFGVVYTKPVSDGGISTASFSDSTISIEYDTGILFCPKDIVSSRYYYYTVPLNITHICENAFADCSDVSYINIPDEVNLKSIGENAFFNSGIFNNWYSSDGTVLIISNYIISSKSWQLSGTYDVSDLIKGIADKAFTGCSGLTGFNCGENTRFLGGGAFSGCSASLKNNFTLSATDNLEYVGEDLFGTDAVRKTEYLDNILNSVSPDVESFTITDGTTVIAAGAFEGCTNLKSISIPDSIKRIDKNTFNGCISLSSVTFKGDITEIGDNAFADCMSLTEISIPASVEEIGHLAFNGCAGMRSFNVAGGNKNYRSDSGVLMSANGSTIIQYPAMKDGDDYSIGDDTFVSDFAFYLCRKLKRIFIGENIEYGNRNPFAACPAGYNVGGKYSEILFGDLDCTVLKSVSAGVRGTFTVPDTVTEIGSDAFRECFGITGIEFSDARLLDTIGDYAFYGCTGLTEITIPNSVKSIGSSAFKNCLNLKNVTFEKSTSTVNQTLASIGENAFCNCPCNGESGSCNYNILSSVDRKKIKELAFTNYGNLESFRNPFCDSVSLEQSGLICGFSLGLDNIENYVNIPDESIGVYCGGRIGTGKAVTVQNRLDKSEDNSNSIFYTAVVFGDVNGDGWYDGTDAMIVSCLANGMLIKEDVSEAVYTAADCNHDGEINNDDVELLQQAGVLLANVDQTKSKEELLETSSAYVEYLNLIDQTVEEDSAEITNVAPTPETAKTLFDILKEIVIKIINYIILNLSILKLR